MGNGLTKRQQGVLLAALDSNVSVSEIARLMGIPYKKAYYWEDKLRKPGEERQMQAADSQADIEMCLECKAAKCHGNIRQCRKWKGEARNE